MNQLPRAYIYLYNIHGRRACIYIYTTGARTRAHESRAICFSLAAPFRFTLLRVCVYISISIYIYERERSVCMSEWRERERERESVRSFGVKIIFRYVYTRAGRAALSMIRAARPRERE